MCRAGPARVWSSIWDGAGSRCGCDTSGAQKRGTKNEGLFGTTHGQSMDKGNKDSAKTSRGVFGGGAKVRW